MSTLKLEVGKYYKTRGGDKVYIAAKIENPFKQESDRQPFIGFGRNIESERTWCEGGGYFINGCSMNDLMSDWVDPAKATATVFLYRDCHGNLGVSLEMPCKGSEILDSKVVELGEGADGRRSLASTDRR
jgi:hypothetical protein